MTNESVNQQQMIIANRAEAKERNEALKKEAAARLKRNAEWNKNNKK